MSTSRPRRGRRSIASRLIIALVLSVVLGAASYGGLRSGIFRGYRLQVSDAFFPSGATDPRIAVVAVDRESLGRVGLRWPWPRQLHAQIINTLSGLGAKVIAFDVVFSPSTPDDPLVAEAARASGRTIMATLTEKRPGHETFVATSLTPPVPDIAASAARLGHSSTTPDSDGVVRSLPLVIETPDGKLQPALSLAVWMQAEGVPDVFTFRPKGLQVGDRFIPTGPLSVLDVNFAPELDVGARRAPILSAVDVLNGKVERADVDGKLVFVGVTDPSLGDHFPTPAAKAAEMPGVFIHANALNTMLTGNYIHSVGAATDAVAAGALALGVALVTLLGFVWLAPIALVALSGAYGLWSFVRFDQGSVHDLVYPLLAALISFIGALVYRYFTELRARRRASALFSQYIPKSVAQQLLDEGRVEEHVRGERIELTVLFCDLRGFTAQSVQMQPTEVRDMLNVYYDETSRLVLQHDGTILNFVGDEVFAVWGAPLADPENALKAVSCARDFQYAASRINQRLTDAGLPTVSYGVGLHTGEVIAAHVGTELRRQYTVLGDTVNCGSRLCTLAGRNEIVVSDDTYQKLDPKPPSEKLPGIRLKGVGRELFPHRLWPDELKDPTGEVRGKLED